VLRFKSADRFANDCFSQVNKSVGKGLAGAIDTGEKVVDSTKQTLGSTKRKATSTTQDAQEMAREKTNQASESTKQTAENARQKLNQAAGDGSNKSGGVRPFSTTSSIHQLIYTCVHSRLKQAISSQGEREI